MSNYDVDGKCIRMSGLRGNIRKDDSSRNLSANQILCHGLQICPQAAAGAFFNSSPDNLRLYVNQALGDDANDGTPLDPLLTLQGAFNRIHELGYNNTAVIEIMDSGGPLLLTSNQTINMDTGCRGKQLVNPVVRGSARQIVVPEQATGAPVVTNPEEGTEVMISGTGFGAAGSMQGLLVRWTSGVLEGNSWWIGNNVNAVSLSFAINTANGFLPANGDTYVVEALTSSINFADGIRVEFLSAGNHRFIEFVDLSFTTSGALSPVITIMPTGVILDGVEFVSTGASPLAVQLFSGLISSGNVNRTNGLPAAQTDLSGNVAQRTGAGLRLRFSQVNITQAQAQLDNMVLHNVGEIRFDGGTAAFLIGCFADNGGVNITGTSNVLVRLLVSRGNTTGEAVRVRRSSTLRLDSALIDGAATTGIDLTDCRVSIQNCTVNGSGSNGILVSQIGGALNLDNVFITGSGASGLAVLTGGVVLVGALTCDGSVRSGIELHGTFFTQAGGGLLRCDSNGLDGITSRWSAIAIDRITPILIDNNGNNGITLNGTRWSSGQITGPANTGTGMSLESASQCVVDAGGVTNVGGVNDCKVGNNGATTWATILTNATASASDWANATTLGCSLIHS